MLIRAGGGTGGLKEYLEHGQKAGRDFHRNELDQRVPLFGDLAVFELATNMYQGEGKKYDHFTLAFSENRVSDEMLQITVEEFRNHVFAAYSEEERHRIPFYAEAHRPRILSYTNKETGEDVERLIHIHFGIGKHDLIDGSFVEPVGYLGERTENLKYIDAFQESFNTRHGFTSPKDHPNISPKNAIDVLAGFGVRPDKLGKQNQKKAALEVTLQKEVLAQNVTTWEEFGKLLSSHGEVSKINEGNFNESYRIKLPGTEKAMRLKGVFFQRQFIERPTAEKLDIIQAKAKAVYREQMQPRKEPEYVNGILAEWHQSRAKELRYLNTGSKLYKEEYLPADAQTRAQILNDLERKNHGITSPSTAKNGKITTTRNRVLGLPIRDMDGIQHRSEMLLRGDASVDVRTIASGEQMGTVVRQADGRDSTEIEGRGRSDDAGVERDNSAFRPGEPIIWPAGRESAEEESHSRRVSGEHLVQPSSVLARIQADMRERYEQAADKERYAEIRQHLDGSQLLASLSHTHGLNPSLYQVTTAKDGTPRIQCGSRALTPSDFLTKELGLPWKEAAPILRQTYEHQLGKKVTTGRGKSAVSPLWQQFKANQLAEKPAQDRQRQMFDGETKRYRTDLFSRLKREQQQALAGLTGISSRKAAQSLAKLNAAQAKAEFNDDRRAMRKALQPAQAQAWRGFLQARAQAGNEEALAALRKLDATARIVPAQAITGTIYLVENEDEKKRRRRARESAATILKALIHHVEVNGDVTYSKNGRDVLRDEGQHIAVLDQNSDEAITAALLLAREKFGPNLTLTGSPEFQRRVVSVAVAQGSPIKFVDPQLEAMRMRLEQIAGKTRQAAPAPIRVEAKAVETVAPTPSNKPAKQGTKAPVPEILAELHQVVEAEQTAAEWIAAQPKPAKPAVAPRTVGDASVPFTVLHVAPDGIVVDHGRAVATYPLPPGLVVQAGDRIGIGRNGELRLPHVPEPGKEKDGGIG